MSIEQIGQFEQKTQPSRPSTIAHNDPAQSENLDMDHVDSDQEDASGQNGKETSESSGSKLVITLKRIIKKQHIWGYHGAVATADTRIFFKRKVLIKFVLLTIHIRLILARG